MNPPLITVIIPCYNSIYLKDAIHSVMSQDYPDIEVIIADDGTENFDAGAVRSLAESMSGENIRSIVLLHSEKNRGTVANYNAAMRRATGDYLYPLAADDVFASADTLSRWTETFIQSGARVCCACCDIYDISLTEFQGRWPRPDHIRLLTSGDSKRIYSAMEVQKILPGCCMARTRESLSSLGYFDEQYRLLEDYPFLMRVLREGEPIGFWPQSAVKHRVGGVSDSKNPHAQLESDMERFYRVDVFPYSGNPELLRKKLAEMEKKKQGIASFDFAWQNAGFPRRLLLSIRQPKMGLRKLYHFLQR